MGLCSKSVSFRRILNSYLVKKENSPFLFLSKVNSFKGKIMFILKWAIITQINSKDKNLHKIQPSPYFNGTDFNADILGLTHNLDITPEFTFTLIYKHKNTHTHYKSYDWHEHTSVISYDDYLSMIIRIAPWTGYAWEHGFIW